MKYQKAAFSFVELIIIVSILGIFAVIAVPRFNYALISKQKVEITARKIVTDLRLTRRLAISDAANNTEGFALQMIGSAPYPGYLIKNWDTLENLDSHTFDSGIQCTGHDKFRFGPLGSLTSVGGNQLTIAAQGKTFTITVNSATGMIKCVEN